METKRLNQLCEEIHQNAKDKGFWDNKRETGTLLMLVVSELSEAMEADRRNRNATNIKLVEMQEGESFVAHFQDKVKDTFEDELADAVIRILDLCGAMNIDIEKHIELKMKYNTTREKMHGKNY